MKNESYLEYLLSDSFSLEKYYKEKTIVTLDDIKRHILLLVRDKHYSVPDHYYRLGLEYSFQGISKLSELFTKGLCFIADEFLEIHDGIVYVKGNRMNDWQLILPNIPPLLLVVLKIWKNFQGEQKSILDYAYEHLPTSLRYTALPPAFLPEMETLKEEICGFSDLHFHLNGALETDIVWQDFLRQPEKPYREIETAWSNSLVKEQFGQFTKTFNAYDFYSLFVIAGQIREWLYEIVICKEKSKFGTLVDFLRKQDTLEKSSYKHPITNVLHSGTSLLVMEGVLYVKIFDYLTLEPQNELVAGAFHYYLLILGLCNKLLVQQNDSFGFEQFQKYTSNNLREFSEKIYYQRFFQLVGNDSKNISHIEGRFSPKDSVEKNEDILRNISNGFYLFKKSQSKNGKQSPTLSLIAHFIKRPDKKDKEIRFEKLRQELERKSDALIAVLNRKSSLSEMIVGVDAAASEFDTPPEVFSPTYNKLRKFGVKHFTYHAGEDFFHILSGLRAVYEAIDFLNLQAGDRIGHATACGVDVSLWQKNIGDRLWMRMEEYMDDLVFSYFLITQSKEPSLQHLLPMIALKVEQYAAKIYSCKISIYELIEAWQLRKQDALKLSQGCAKEESEVQSIFRKYHSAQVRENGKRIISVDAYDIFSEKDLICLQQEILKIMHEKQIVIETLPTSNVFIGHHHDFSTYHLYNWYKWSKSGIKVPAIVVGSDDTGVFATNIYNEYCHIYCTLVYENGVSVNEAVDYIERLNHNSKVYAFRR